MILYEDTVPGIFVRRVNRFVAEVLIEGSTERVHVKNTGRLGELLLPEAEVTLQKASDPARKTVAIAAKYKAAGPEAGRRELSGPREGGGAFPELLSAGGSTAHALLS